MLGLRFGIRCVFSKHGESNRSRGEGNGKGVLHCPSVELVWIAFSAVHRLFFGLVNVGHVGLQQTLSGPVVRDQQKISRGSKGPSLPEATILTLSEAILFCTRNLTICTSHEKPWFPPKRFLENPPPIFP